jgi:hypothetical protein
VTRGYNLSLKRLIRDSPIEKGLETNEETPPEARLANPHLWDS